MNKIIIFMGMVCLLLPGIITAQDKAGTQSLKPKPAATAVVTVPEKAELELQKVIPIFKAIAWDQFKKSTFETVAQYHARIAKLEFPREKILFELDLNDVKARYEAEKQLLSFALSHEIAFGIEQPQNPALHQVAKTSVKTGESEAQSALGVKVTVQKYKEENFQFLFTNLKELPKRLRMDLGYSQGIGLSASLPPDSAKRMLKANEIVLVFGVAIESLEGAHQYFQLYEPKVDAPSQSSVYIYVLPARLTDVKLYNRVTHEVLASWSAAKK